ncbi:MAG: hypothetical protein HUU55_00995 [Myxococcales bacterium]|nr:hypothetical protein [Myxococcales bacterium]
MGRAKVVYGVCWLFWVIGTLSGCLSNEGRGLWEADLDGLVTADGANEDSTSVDTSAQNDLATADVADVPEAVDAQSIDDVLDDSGVIVPDAGDVTETGEQQDMDIVDAGDVVVIPPECVADEECGLGELIAPCYVPVCVDGMCQINPAADGSLCDDSDWCTASDQCVGGVCSGIATDCDDNNPCTVDVCVSNDGSCQHDTVAANQVVCDDGDTCTTNDVCLNGVCAGTPLVCQDANPCTVDSCSTDTGKCVFDAAGANGMGCDDNDGCTAGDVCLAGACSSGSQVCACQQDTDCPDDGDLCNGTYVCKTDGAPETWTCVVDPATVIVCSPDGDTTCLKNLCDKLTGQCAKTPSGAGLTCDDVNACTLNDACDGKGQCLGTPKVCTDGYTCTSDSCGADGQCVFSIAPTACLVGGVCYASGASMPGNGCMSCVPNVNNQSFSPNSATCDDGNACTLGDVCNGGSCKSGAAKPCNDNDPCTDDTCQAPSGQCNYTDNGSCPKIPTYSKDIQPIFLNQCGGCHEGASAGDCLGATCLTSDYAATQQPSYYCPGETVGACCLTRVLDGTMPDGFGCTGKPAQDAGKDYCFDQNEIDTLEAWILGGQPQ